MFIKNSIESIEFFMNIKFSRDVNMLLFILLKLKGSYKNKIF